MGQAFEPRWEAIGNRIKSVTGLNGRLTKPVTVGGGDINRAVRAELGATGFFIKLNDDGQPGMFEAEAKGLEELSRSRTLRIPKPVCHGHEGGTAYLVLEYLALSRRGNSTALGAGLAAMHRVTRPEFGWDIDNTIGSTPQINTASGDWTEFWRRHRLGYQLKLAAARGYAGKLQESGATLLASFHHLFDGYAPRASLLHGDLWTGNYAFTGSGEPVIYDPAVYFGDRETDLAMTELFGRFSPDFYAAYRHNYPLDPGYRVRKRLYQLYHVLNHLNLFGSSYQAQAQHLIDSLLGELG